MNQAAIVAQDEKVAQRGSFRIVLPTAEDILSHSVSVAGGLAKSERFSMHDWVYGFETNPRQRETENRADRVNKTYLAKPSLDHLFVNGAICKEDENFYKLDGHTRAELWSTGKLAAFDDHVIVNLLVLETLEEVKDHYTHYDSAGAVEKPSEKAQGSIREQGLMMESGFFSSGQFTNCCRVALGFFNTGNCPYNIYEMAGILKNFLPKADHLFTLRKNSRKAPMDQGMSGAMLLTLMADPAAAEAFWTLYMTDGGIKDAQGRDAVLALRDRAADKNTKHGGDAGIRDAANAAISAFHHWKNNKRFGTQSQLISRSKPLDISQYVQMAHQAGGIVLP